MCAGEVEDGWGWWGEKKRKKIPSGAVVNEEMPQEEQQSALQTHHVYSKLKRRGNSCFHVVSTWNTRGVFIGRSIAAMQQFGRIIE